MRNYEDIRNHERYQLKHHTPMSLESRAAQFAPFAALVGYDEEIGEAARVWKKRSRCTECRQCKEKHGFPAGVQKVCKSVQNPRKWKIPRGIIRFLVGFWCARGELESLAL